MNGIFTTRLAISHSGELSTHTHLHVKGDKKTHIIRSGNDSDLIHYRQEETTTVSC